MTSSLGRSLSNGLSTSLTPFPVLLSKNENAVLPLGRRIRLPFPTVHASIHWMQSRPHMSDSATQTSSSSSALSRSNPSSSAAVSAALNPIASPPQACPWNSWHSFQSLSFIFSPDCQWMWSFTSWGWWWLARCKYFAEWLGTTNGTPRWSMISASMP